MSSPTGKPFQQNARRLLEELEARQEPLKPKDRMKIPAQPKKAD